MASSLALSPPAAGPSVPANAIRLRGVRVHNLKNIDVDIPRDHLVVITGPSGSGKSSLAFDTLFAEGQRQYIESLSVYARQFLHQLQRPDLDTVDGLEPTIAVDQRAGSRNPRSTVATVTEIYDYLRLLFARLGEPACYRCGAVIRQQSAGEIVDAVLALPAGSKVMLLAPLVRGRKGSQAEVFEAIRKARLVRARVDGEVYDLDHLPELAPRKAHQVDAVVDRLIVREGLRPRLAESLQLALALGSGAAIVVHLPPAGGDAPGAASAAAWSETLYSTVYACPHCKLSYAELEPRTFSFNSPYGACPACQGLGRVAPQDAAPAARASGRRAAAKADAHAAEPLAATELCGECGGARLRPEARAVRLAGQAIQEVTALSVEGARQFFAAYAPSAADQPVARPILAQIVRRLEFLAEVGVEYLSLDRAADTLSGGELQRVRLATAIGSGLVGVCYVLDEPSIGLHPRDNGRLIAALRRLVDQGNTVVVVEHDEAAMRAADWLIDMGPGAGRDGGRIVAAGTPGQVAAQPASPTGAYLSGRSCIAVPAARRPVGKSRGIVLEGVTTHNLQNVDLWLPLGALVCVTGVSGSGKSSLVNETLAPAVARRLGLVAPPPGPFRSLRGAGGVEKLVLVDQAPIGRSPRSSPATYSGAFDEIRKVFAATRQARQRGYRVGRFSFNAAGGRCEECKGHGVQRIEMNFLPDLSVPCPACGGARFNRQTLSVKFHGRSIADVLALRIAEAAALFENVPAIARTLASFVEVGLGYLALGQPATTLSGGEAQRTRLATELARPAGGHTLYVLDEPTTGLHFDDVRRLLAVLGRLVDRGHTVLVIEHHLDVIKSADWVIDLGPGGGADGGRVVATGTPEEVAASGTATGQYLRAALVARTGS